jgi:hypothetical protein
VVAAFMSRDLRDEDFIYEDTILHSGSSQKTVRSTPCCNKNKSKRKIYEQFDKTEKELIMYTANEILSVQYQTKVRELSLSSTTGFELASNVISVPDSPSAPPRGLEI